MNNILLIPIIFLFFPLIVSAPILLNPYPERIIEYNPNNPREWALEAGLIQENDLSDSIIHCESSWNPKVCNNVYFCRKGMGLWQIVVSTWNETIVRMSKDGAYLPGRCWQFISHPISEERREIVFDGECNLLAGLWLLEHDEDIHWQKYSGQCYLKDYVKN